MNIDETKQICQKVCQIENRVWTPEINRAWHGLLSNLDFEVANRAATLALQDHNILQVAPKHILAKVPAAVNELNSMLRSAENSEEGWKSEPQPVCREHDLPILKCFSCCDLLRVEAGHLHGDRLHEWAIAHVYRADSLVGEGARF